VKYPETFWASLVFSAMDGILPSGFVCEGSIDMVARRRRRQKVVLIEQCLSQSYGDTKEKARRTLASDG
jgi:hypothetical protein